MKFNCSNLTKLNKLHQIELGPSAELLVLLLVVELPSSLSLEWRCFRLRRFPCGWCCLPPPSFSLPLSCSLLPPWVVGYCRFPPLSWWVVLLPPSSFFGVVLLSPSLLWVVAPFPILFYKNEIQLHANSIKSNYIKLNSGPLQGSWPTPSVGGAWSGVVSLPPGPPPPPPPPMGRAVSHLLPLGRCCFPPSLFWLALLLPSSFFWVGYKLICKVVTYHLQLTTYRSQRKSNNLYLISHNL